MNPDTLPYAILLLLSEFSIGCALVLAALEFRGLVPVGYIKVCTGTALAGAGLALAVVLSVAPASEVGGYLLESSWFFPARIAIAAFAVASLLHNVAAFLWPDGARRAVSYVAAFLGLIALVLLAAIFQRPTWGYAGEFLSLLMGGLSLGAVTLGMLLGHWYLVNPKLSEKPLNELIVGMLIVLVLQIAVVTVNSVLPARDVPLTETGFDLGLGANPAFWLRVAVGFVFPLVLGFMAWQSSRMRGMMSATGLLYIATGAVLAGQALARGLLFITGVAV